jgi:hypothetical protein
MNILNILFVYKKSICTIIVSIFDKYKIQSFNSYVYFSEMKYFHFYKIPSYCKVFVSFRNLSSKDNYLKRNLLIQGGIYQI